MKKQWFITPALIILIIVGLVLIVNKPIRNKMIETKTNDNQIENVSKETLEQNEEAPATFDATEIKPVSTEDVVASTFTQSEKSFLTVAGIAIPELNMNLPIYKGLANEVLLSGAGTMKPTQKMGQGNYALASHNYFGDMTLLFSPLVNLKVGDKIYTTDLEYVYEYETTSVELIEPTRVEVINDQSGVTEITLITCDDYNATKRYCFKGKYVSKTPVSEASDSVKQAFNLNFNTIQ